MTCNGGRVVSLRATILTARVMESGWLKARVIVTKDDNGKTKIARDSGVPNDTHVIATVPNRFFYKSSDLEEVWQRCVNSAALIPVQMVGSSDLPIPSSPLDASSGSLSLSNDLSLYMCETITMQYQLKHRGSIWIQPMRSHPVEEVWLRPSLDSAKEKFMEQFLEQVHERSKINTIIVRLDKMLQFTLNNAGQMRKCDNNGLTELWFDVVHVLPIAQGHLTTESKIVILPPDLVSPRRSNSDTDSDDDGGEYDLQERIITKFSDSDDSEDEDSYLGSHDRTLVPQPRQPLLSASQIRRSSVVTMGNNNIHLLKCIPLYDFPQEKNFILLTKNVREELGCYGLENLLISPVEYPGHHDNRGIRYVAVIEDYKGSHVSKHAVYVHPEVYYNLFPYPVDHLTTHHEIKAEV